MNQDRPDRGNYPDQKYWNEGEPYNPNNRPTGTPQEEPPFQDLDQAAAGSPAPKREGRPQARGEDRFYTNSARPAQPEQPYYNRGGREQGESGPKQDRRFQTAAHAPVGHGPGQRPQGRPQKRPSYGNKAANAKPNAAESVLVREFTSFFKGFFSANPSDALKEDLSTPAWVTLIVVNWLFFALAQATVAVKMGVDLGMGLDIFKVSWGKSFAMGLIQQAVVILIFCLAAWLLAGQKGGQKLAPVQYLKMLSYATPLHSILSLVIIIFALIYPMGAVTLQLMNRLVLFFSFNYVYDTVYPQTRTTRFWPNILILLILSVLSMLF
ncbi:MAG: hypothetical protein Q4E09_00365 [Eubacteriales bacterium]|nr:hypothetical protein [Eubacteriales bacterium]